MSLFTNGSQWLKVDFHLHTKADKEFVYKDEENEFIKKYIEKLKENEINIGVITNHNKFDLVEYRRLKKKSKKEEIYLMSGVELSINDGSNGIHSLIVFDYDNWIKNGENYIEQFLNSVFEGIPNRENENTQCKYSFKEIIEKLEEHKKNGRDSFMVMAHIEQSKGILKEMNGGRLKNLCNTRLFYENILGFQKLRTYDEIEKLKEWFNIERQIPAFVEGSDCKKLEEVGKMGIQRNENGERIQKSTYIKIGNFNFKAIKGALQDKENRIKADKKSEINNSYIKSIHIESGEKGLLKGKTINFSPEMNNFIGIRGSGKSAILELIRYVLGIPLTSEAVDKNYKNNLVDYVLKSGSKISLLLVNKHKEEYRIEKIGGQKEDIFKGDQKINATVSGILSKTPVYFGQKDLSNKDINFESNLVKKLIGHKLEEIHGKIKNKKSELKQIILKYKNNDKLEEDRIETENKKNNAGEKIQIYKKKGIEKKLKMQSNYDSDLRNLINIKRNIDNFYKQLNDIYEGNIDIFNNFSFQSDENPTILNNAKNIIDEIKKELEAVEKSKNNIEKENGRFVQIIEKLENKREKLKEEFAKLKREIEVPDLDPDEFLDLIKIIEISNLKLEEIKKMEKSRNQIKSDIDKKIYELNSLWLEEYRIIDEEVVKINRNNEQLKINVDFKGERTKFLDKQKKIFKGSGISNLNYTKIVEKYSDFIEMFKDDVILKNEILNDKHYFEYKKIYNNNLEELLLYQVDNKYTITYDKKTLNNHSLGQRATGLVLFLLAQKETDILIIDQPEDDLDNQTIYNEVIKNINELKGEMQFIFATHNANIPVLGDSEKIITCKFEDEKINIHEGNIDEKETQKNIIDVMEGGKDAFEKRKNIYSLWRLDK